TIPHLKYVRWFLGQPKELHADKRLFKLTMIHFKLSIQLVLMTLKDEFMEEQK
ncbi:hypothetical protein CHS0354_001439, partial [Potamilus streckersoni]